MLKLRDSANKAPGSTLSTKKEMKLDNVGQLSNDPEGQGGRRKVRRDRALKEDEDLKTG